jgi:carbon monoxide dehydrogenase subunit G
MELINDIEVNAPVEEVWAAFNDPERIAPCLPGAQLQEIEGDDMRGLVKVKVGPITAQYKGVATYQERDKDKWHIVIKGDGRGTSGNASAIITADLDPVDDNTTKVSVITDLTITGKVAQFGRGAITDVSTKLMGQFAANLEKLIEEGSGSTEAPPAPVAEGTEPVIRKIDAPEAEAVDLLEVAGTPLLKRIGLPVGVLFVLIVLRRMLSGD